MVHGHLFPLSLVAPPACPEQISATMSDSETLQFYFDYVDPASYILMRNLQSMAGFREMEVEYLPLEIVLPSQPILHPEDEAFRLRWATMEGHASESGLSFPHPWIVPWTRKAHELALHARAKNSFGEIHEALFRAYLIESKDIGRIDILVEIARAGGLDPLETKAVLDVDRYGDEVDQARARALADGCSGPPTLKWKNAIFDGDPSPEALRSFLASGLDRETP